MILTLSARSVFGLDELGFIGLFGGGGGRSSIAPYLFETDRTGNLQPTGTTRPTPGQAWQRSGLFDLEPSALAITSDPYFELDLNGDLQPISS